MNYHYFILRAETAYNFKVHCSKVHFSTFGTIFSDSIYTCILFIALANQFLNYVVILIRANLVLKTACVYMVQHDLD